MVETKAAEKMKATKKRTRIRTNNICKRQKRNVMKDKNAPTYMKEEDKHDVSSKETIDGEGIGNMETVVYQINRIENDHPIKFDSIDDMERNDHQSDEKIIDYHTLKVPNDTAVCKELHPLDDMEGNDDQSDANKIVDDCILKSSNDCAACKEFDSSGVEMVNDHTPKAPNDKEISLGQVKKVRGTSILKVPDENNQGRSKVFANKYGIPIGSNAQGFTSDITNVVKATISVKYTSWVEVPEESVSKCWKYLHMLYIIDPTDSCLKKWIDSKMKERWGQFKSRLFKSIQKKCTNIEDQIRSRPINISDTDWEIFIWHRNSKEFREKSKRQSEYMKKRKTHHHLGRRSLAQVEHNMKKNSSTGQPIHRYHLWKEAFVSEKTTPNALYTAELAKEMDNRIASGSSIVTSRNDVIVEVLGLDKRGRARSMGGTTTPTMAFGAQNYRTELHETKSQLHEANRNLETNNALVQKMANEMAEIKKMLKENGHIVQTSCSTVQKKYVLSLESKTSKINCNVKSGRIVVAMGGCISVGPNYVYGSSSIGEGNCLVYVCHVDKPLTPLPKPDKFNKTIGDADANCIIWPLKDIEFVEENKIMVDVNDLDEFSVEGNSRNTMNRHVPAKIHEHSGITVSANLLSHLDGSNWLSDEVIDLYFSLLKEREKRIGVSDQMMKCHYFDYSFYKKLTSKDYFDYERVKDCTKHLDYRITNCRFVFVPIIINSHWSLGVIDIKKRKIMHLDSLFKSDKMVFANLTRYIINEFKDKNYVDMDMDDWIAAVMDDLPQQHNRNDCGVYVLKFAEMISRGFTRVHFNQADVSSFRQTIKSQLQALKID